MDTFLEQAIQENLSSKTNMAVSTNVVTFGEDGRNQSVAPPARVVPLRQIQQASEIFQGGHS